MTTSHHVSDDLLVSYEAGTLAEGWSLAVATHLALCPECRQRARDAAAIGGALLDEIEPEPVSEGALDRLLERIEAGPAATQAAPAATGSAVLPEPLRSYVGGDADTLRWKPLGTGAHQILIKTADSETSVRMLRIAAGKPVPEHGHRGTELTVVICGTLIDGEEVFARGDIEIADEGIEHQPFAGPGEDCICLAVTDAPLRFKNLLVRLAQPFLRI